jgi:hypothetical protein
MQSLIVEGRQLLAKVENKDEVHIFLSKLLDQEEFLEKEREIAKSVMAECKVELDHIINAEVKSNAEYRRKIAEVDALRANLRTVVNASQAATTKFFENTRKNAEEYQVKATERARQEKLDEERISRKLNCTCTYESLLERTFVQIRTQNNFLRLSFLSDILEDWDLSKLIGTNKIIAEAGLGLDRTGDEREFYYSLFKELNNREYLIHFLAWCVIGEELSESVIDLIAQHEHD